MIRATELRRSPSWETVDFGRTTSFIGKKSQIQESSRGLPSSGKPSHIFAAPVSQRLRHFLFSEQNASIIFLITIGLVSCMNAFALNLASASLAAWKFSLCELLPFPGSFLLSLHFW